LPRLRPRSVWGRVTLQDEVIYERRAANAGLFWYWFDRFLEKHPELKQRWEENLQRHREEVEQRILKEKEASEAMMYPTKPPQTSGGGRNDC